MRLLWVFSHPAPYKRQFFSLLGQKVELTAVFENEREDGRHPCFYKSTGEHYVEKFLPKRGKGKALLKEMREGSYDLVVMNGWAQPAEMRGILELNKTKTPYFFLINGGRIKERESCLRKALKRKFIRSPYATFLSPDPISSEYLRHYAGRDIPIREYVYSTIHAREIPDRPATREERLALMRSLSIPGERLYISIGNYIPRKNLMSLLRLWRRMEKEDTLLLLGNGKQESEYETFIRENNLTNVILGGFRPHEETLSLLRASECSFFPTKEDIYGHAVNESLSQGTPVICSPNTNAGLHLIQGKNDGLVVSFENEEPIIRQLNAGFADEIRENALKVARKNTYEAMLDSFLLILEEWEREHRK